MPGNRDLLKVVRERTQSLLRSCYHTFSKSLLGSVKVYTEGFRVLLLNGMVIGCKSINLYPIV